TILFSAACQLYLSQDDGATWAARSESMPACTASGSSTGGVSQMAFDGGFLYVLRQQFLSGNRPSWGLYRRPSSELGLAGTTTAAEGGAPSADLALALAPNPASGTTRLQFTLDTPQDVRVTVFDVLGRSVLTLAEGPRGAGVHDLPWDASSLRPGVYIVRLDAGAAGQSAQRITVVR
ncbi:MAG TPA: T9SS type A sorting domain-containing protein, partial [Rubricoccaceae bacterium]